MVKEDYSLYKEKYDLENCDAEPLHRIHSIQPFSEIIISDTTTNLWIYATDKVIEDLNHKSILQILKDYTGLTDIDTSRSTYIRGLHNYDLIIIVNAQCIIYELESNDRSWDSKIDSAYQKSILEIMSETDLDKFLESSITEVKQNLNYDQVMLYKFDHDGSGKIIIEDKEDHMPSYLGLKFPASDIPEQARALYKINNIRSVYDTSSSPNKLRKNPQYLGDYQLDLSHVHARGVSPIHIQYLQNMGVNSSFSLAINVDDKLWGLIACHHRSKRFLSHDEREWLKLMSGLISSQVSLHRSNNAHIDKLKYKVLNNDVFKSLRKSNDLVATIEKSPEDLLDMFQADGLAVYVNGNYVSHGLTIDQLQTFRLTKHIENKVAPNQIYTSDSMPIDMQSEDGPVAGYLFIPLSSETKNFILIYRKERKYNEVWAGDPSTSKDYDPDQQKMNPRKSFAKWQNEVKGRSLPWTSENLQHANLLKSNILSAIYERYDELKQVYAELEFAYAELEKFSSILSHDLKSPLRSIESFSDILMMDYADVIDAKGIDLLDTIHKNSLKMKKYIDGILQYSKFSQSTIRATDIDINRHIQQELKNISLEYPKLEIEQDLNLKIVRGDELMIMQAINNLLDNAAKYSSKKSNPTLKISTYKKDDKAIIIIKDNGIGIPDKMMNSIFDMYRRAVSDKEYDGTGLGLSIVKNIIERHAGTITAEHNTPEGSIFTIKLPYEGKN